MVDWSAAILINRSGAFNTELNRAIKNKRTGSGMSEPIESQMLRVGVGRKKSHGVGCAGHDFFNTWWNVNFDPAEAVVFFMQGSAGLPVSGDWNGDGLDTMGFFDRGFFLLRNRNTTGPFEEAFNFGRSGDRPVAGDWDRKP
jgi:hypothetical protein